MQIICMDGGMNQPLPYGGFDWLSEKEINKLN